MKKYSTYTKYIIIVIIIFTNIKDANPNSIIKNNHQISKQENTENDYTTNQNLREHAEFLSNIEIPKSFTNDELIVVFKECEKYKLPVGIILRLIQTESSFRKNAKSYMGARGYMQLMPRTYKHFKVIMGLKPKDNHKNLKVGIYYLNHLYEKWDTYPIKIRWKMTLLSYNYGITKVKNNESYFKSPKFDSYWYITQIMN